MRQEIVVGEFAGEFEGALQGGVEDKLCGVVHKRGWSQRRHHCKRVVGKTMIGMQKQLEYC